MRRAVPLAFVSFLAVSPLLASCGDDHHGNGGAGNAGTTASGGSTSSGAGGQAGSTTGGSGGDAGSGGNAGLPGIGGSGGSDATGGTSGTGTGAAGSNVIGNHPAKTLYAAVCDLHRACCETAGVQENAFTTCDVSGGASIYQASIDAGRLAIDEAALASCAEHLRVTYLGCDSVLGFNDTFASFPDCVAGIAGAVPLGEYCAFDEECAGAGDGRIACLNDACIAVPIGQAGDPCIQTKGPRSTRLIPTEIPAAGGAECRRQDGLYCSGDADTGYNCAPVLADGAPCDAEEQCGAASYCGTETCEPVHARDASCASNSECGALYCNHDSFTCTSLPDRVSCEE